MKRNITFYTFLLLTFTFSWAGTPVMDGEFDGTGVWGQPRAVADLVPGFGNANAKRLYMTADANYIYVGVEITAASWFKFAFLINTKPGGGTVDSWGQKIVYNHTDKPDYVFRGTLGRFESVVGNDFGNIAEFHTWSGAEWTGVGDRIVNNGPTYSVADNIPNDFSEANGFIEVRIARTVIISDISLIDVQFLLIGDSNNSGPYDCIPNDNNATEFTSTDPIPVSNYAMNLSVVSVTWLDFAAKAQKEGSVDLNWTTASEKQNNYFDIQRSANGYDWTSIGTVKGNGTTTLKNTYQFMDNAPLSSVNYYRLKQVDFDGKFDYSRTVSVNMLNNSSKRLSVYPNPVSDKLNIVSNGLDTEGSVQVFNMKGSVVKTSLLIGNQLDVYDLPNGLYQIRLIDRNGATTNIARFVKK